MPSSSIPSSGSRSAALLRGLEPRDRAPLEALIRGTEMFYEADVVIALELIDLGITPGGGGYSFAVAEREERAVGYACWALNPMSDAVHDLYWIAVERAQQGTGLGRRLLTHVEDQVRAAKGRSLMIETGGKQSYAPTRAFYVACGYSEVARLEDFFRIGDDKVVFAKRLDR
ncbi:MAG: GNAT family N-acetyltransferase [Planctomycetota bacterium]